MGQIVSVRCPKCGYSATLNVGVGKKYNEFEYVIELFDDEAKEKIREAINKHGSKNWNVRIDIGVCSKCKKVVEIPIFTVMTEAGEPIVIASKCKCGSRAKTFEVDRVIYGKDELLCPLCGEDLKVEVRGLWD
ncbi:hypothetical protein [Butyrivibrio sp. YAB3001]|uniref:hypothetical protein n=1 Tax=Butyrivibrio sp. YAB3001 TaxID=1520812 RepID=UPI0008F67DFD|nr:hypothetical protein [Butyrivibrio sp. YAB3001]SFC11290.1 hypothetical protein SAMN02910398_01535 [Butyrivibrio sp. YAB3001]